MKARVIRQVTIANKVALSCQQVYQYIVVSSDARVTALTVFSFQPPSTGIFTKHCLRGYINTRQQSREMGVVRNKNGKLHREGCIIKIRGTYYGVKLMQGTVTLAVINFNSCVAKRYNAPLSLDGFILRWRRPPWAALLFSHQRQLFDLMYYNCLRCDGNSITSATFVSSRNSTRTFSPRRRLFHFHFGGPLLNYLFPRSFLRKSLYFGLNGNEALSDTPRLLKMCTVWE